MCPHVGFLELQVWCSCGGGPVSLLGVEAEGSVRGPLWQAGLDSWVGSSCMMWPYLP